MMNRNGYVIGLLLVIIGSFTNCRKAEVPEYQIAAESATHLNVHYGTDVKQTMDVYLPANRTSNTNVVIFIHGGSFIGGDKNEVTSLSKYMVEKGFAVINANYRLVDGTGIMDNPPKHILSAIKIKDQVDDVAAIVDYAIKSAKTWVMSPTRIAIAGYSAGGTLGLLYSYDARNANKVQAVANIAGPVDLLFTDIPNWQLMPPFMLEGGYRYTGVEVSEANADIFKSISPIYVANDQKRIPTFTVVPETNEVLGFPKLDISTYNRFTTRLTALKIPNEFYYVPGADHYFSRQGDWYEVLDQTLNFFNLRLK